MEDVLWSSELYRITFEKETEPDDDSKIIKWKNKGDEAHELIWMSTSNDLQFHLQVIDELNTTWEKLETVFGKKNEIQGH